jgi:hypothetical protein
MDYFRVEITETDEEVNAGQYAGLKNKYQQKTNVCS